VIDLWTDTVETADDVASRVTHALDHIPAARLVLAPDCGMKFMERDIAFGKLAALTAGAAVVRSRLRDVP
jgi:5-methyltetrahydropteroyltriglutamate--homocysteine methyltransferase